MSQSGASVAVPAPVAVMVGTAVSGAPLLVQSAPVRLPLPVVAVTAVARVMPRPAARFGSLGLGMTVSVTVLPL